MSSHEMSDSVQFKFNLDAFLNQSFLSVLSFYYDAKIHMKFTYFAHNKEGQFYLTSPCHINEFEPLKQEQDVSVLIYKEEDSLQDIHQILIEGKAYLMDLESAECKLAYQVLGKKSPFIGQFTNQENNHKQYGIIQVTPHQIFVHSVSLMEKKLPPVILNRIN